MNTISILAKMSCPECEGAGVFYAPRCEHPGCYRKYTVEELQETYYSPDWRDSTVKVKLPCGHDLKNLQDEYPCQECEGTGEVERWLSLDELKKLMERLPTS